MPIAAFRTPGMFASRHWKIVAVWAALIIALIVSLQQYFLGSNNNFIIFSRSFAHLLQGINLYLPYPAEYDDLFLYNPTFAVLFAPLAALPTWPGMLIWTCASILIYLYAIEQLPLASRNKVLVLLLCLPDCINSLQHMQVNHLNLAFMLLAFSMMRKGRPFLAAFFTVVVLYIKVYPAAIGLCFLFYPNKIKYLLGCCFWFALLFALPLVFISWHQLLSQYQNWFVSLKADETVEECATSLSLISIDYQWLSRPIKPQIIQLVGLSMLLLPLVFQKRWFAHGRWQLLYLSAILLFVILFNHAAESATYLLAVTGVAIWFAVLPASKPGIALLILVVLFTVLSITDIFPSVLKRDFIQPYSIRAVPCLLVWLHVMYTLLNPTKLYDVHQPE